MKISGGQTESGVVYGNAYDKYGSKNPIVRVLMTGFERSLTQLVEKASPLTIHEVGCGEGYWTQRWLQQGIEARGSDFSEGVIEIAKANAKEKNIPSEIFKAKSIYDLEPHEDRADLVVCCEVLEHLEFPEQALTKFQSLVKRHLILSVPREPIWRVMNLTRGKYVAEFGNTPGHIQHWSTKQFVSLVKQYFEVIEVKTPLPWTMLLCQVKNN